MTDAPATPADNGQPTVEQAALAADAIASGAAVADPPVAPLATAGGAAADERPERAVAAAFAGGLVFALFLKRLAR